MSMMFKRILPILLCISILSGFLGTCELTSAGAANVPKPSVNSSFADGYDYSERGASLRIYDQYGNVCEPDSQLIRFTASFTLPSSLKFDDIIDFGFVYTKAKVFNNGIDPITNSIYDYESSFVIGGKLISALNVYSTGGNYSVRKDSDGNTAYTFNLVIDVDKENWSDHYAVRCFVKYDYAQTRYTVYDDSYSSRTVEDVARSAYESMSGSADSSENEYSSVIYDHILSGCQTSLTMLSQSNKLIVNENGSIVRLTGVNLGDWLLQESWMGPVSKTDADEWGEYDTYSALVNRFGRESADALMDIYRSNFLTDTDLDTLKKIGVNCVRVPFWFENFTYSGSSFSNFKVDASGEKIGFSYLDWIINECGKRNIYVILDFHGLYGFQSSNHCTGRANAMSLFTLTSKKGLFDSQAYVNSCTVNPTYLTANKELWIAIAQRYKDNPTVAGYDLMNEPLNESDFVFRKPTSISKYSRGDCYEGVLDELYQAIRTVDTNHIIIMEGIWDIDELPKLSKYNWTNVAYSCHNYNYSESELEQKVSSYKSFGQSVPMFVGEWEASDNDNDNGGKGLRKTTTDIYKNAGFSWCTWTYKAVKKSNVGEGWYMVGACAKSVIDPETSSYSDIKNAWSTYIATKYPDTSQSSWISEMSGYYAPLPD